MSKIQRYMRGKDSYEPASYTSNETATVISAPLGTLWDGICMVHITQVFNGSGTAAIIIVGDGDDPNGGLVDGNADETTVGVYIGGGAYFTTRPKLYAVNDTIDIGFTANTSGTRTEGILNLMVEVGRISPW